MKAAVFSPFFFHVMDVTFPYKGRCADAVLPITNKLGLRIVDDDARQSGLVSDDGGRFSVLST